MIQKLIQMDKFRLVYWVIAIVTAQHTAWGAATTMQGSQGEGTLVWWLQGLGFAIGIDFLMVMVATKIRGGTSHRHKWYLLTFATVASISFYFQLLYTWEHSDVLNTGSGIAQAWITRLQGLVDARVIIAPLALPLVATLYTIGGLGKGGEAQSKRNVANKLHNLAVQPDRQSGAISIEKPQPLQLAAKAQGIAIRNEKGLVVGWRCPGCNKDLSISGWSRHRHSCSELALVISHRE